MADNAKSRLFELFNEMGVRVLQFEVLHWQGGPPWTSAIDVTLPD